MAYLIGLIVGGTMAMILSGSLAAWLLRKIAGINYRPSCLLGISGMTLVCAWSITDAHRPSFFGNWIVYLFCGAIALTILLKRQHGKGVAALPKGMEAQ